MLPLSFWAVFASIPHVVNYAPLNCLRDSKENMTLSSFSYALLSVKSCYVSFYTHYPYNITYNILFGSCSDSKVHVSQFYCCLLLFTVVCTESESVNTNIHCLYHSHHRRQTPSHYPEAFFLPFVHVWIHIIQMCIIAFCACVFVRVWMSVIFIPVVFEELMIWFIIMLVICNNTRLLSTEGE